MGKVKQVIMGDIEAEEKARAKAEAKREQKKLREKTDSHVSEDLSKSAEILKMMEKDQLSVVGSQSSEPSQSVVGKSVKKKSEKQKTGKPESENRKLKTENQIKSKHGKKYQEMLSKVEKNKPYPLAQALKLAQETSYSSFDGSIEVHFNVVEKGLRGSVALPHGTGKTVKVVIATEELINEIASTSKYDFDILVAHPSLMPKLAKVAKILGPKGLMPNPKTGTIGDKPEELVKKLTQGLLNWKTEPTFPIVHATLGKVSFETNKLEENYLALAKSIGKDKIKSVFVKATMGPSVKVQV